MMNDKLVDSAESAEFWFARMRQPVDSSTEAEFQQWLQNADNARAYDQCLEVWGMTASLADDPVVQEYMQGLADKLMPQTSAIDTQSNVRPLKVTRWPWFYPSLASAAAVALFAILLFPQREVFVQYHTAPGQQQTITLEDGSTALLNTNSEIGVRYQTKQRHILLRKGEVIFSVAKNKDRPFVVTAGERNVTAVGTRFNVWRDGQKTTVAVLEGKVSVGRERTTNPADTPLLVAGQALYYLADGKVSQILPADIRRIDAWTKGHLEFDSVPLAQVIQDYNRYTQKPIVITDKQLQSRPISGVFQTGNTASFLAALKLLVPINVVEQPEKIILTPVKP